MRRRLLLLVTGLAVLVGGITAVVTPASAQPGSGTTCKVNRSYVSVDDSGTVTVGGGSGRPIDCYY